MAKVLEYVDRNLQQLFAEMEPKRRLQAIKGAFRKSANRVRRIAVNNLRSSVQSNKDLEKGIRSIVFREKAGFRVTIGTRKANRAGKGEVGFHTNRQGLKKPILIWAEEGTKLRRTKSNGKRRALRLRSAHSTGRMRRYGFLAKTLESVRYTVTADLHKEVINNVHRVSKKYGCN